MYKVHQKICGLLLSWNKRPCDIETITSSRSFRKNLSVTIVITTLFVLVLQQGDIWHSSSMLFRPSKSSEKCKMTNHFVSKYDQIHETLADQTKLQKQASIKDPSDSKLLPITVKIAQEGSFICPLQPVHLVGESEVRMDLESIDEDIEKVSAALKQRLASVKYYPNEAKPLTESGPNRDNDVTLEKLLRLSKAEDDTHEQPPVDLPLTLSKPPQGVVPPPHCVPHRRTAIIIPYRDRLEHLKIFLRHMHKHLKHQEIEYGIYVINLAGKGKFNRAKLLNIGFREAIRHYHNYDCVIFHDVDLLPENDHNLYTCDRHPKHMSVAIDIFQYKLPYDGIFGGVTAMTLAQFYQVNGYSNMYWGWGGEDDDMYKRIVWSCMTVSRIATDIAKYKMISHTREKGNEVMAERYNLLKGATNRMTSDGMSDLDYIVLNRSFDPLYNNITVVIGGPKDILGGLTLMQHTFFALGFLFALYVVVLKTNDVKSEKT